MVGTAVAVPAAVQAAVLVAVAGMVPEPLAAARAAGTAAEGGKEPVADTEAAEEHRPAGHHDPPSSMSRR